MVTGTREKNLTVVLKDQNHELKSDVSQANGGDDSAFSPHELIEAGLAACTMITVQMYANRKGWPLTSTDVKVNIESETKEGAVFSREVKFNGDLTAEQKSRLFEIANKCPVHELLTRGIKIETSML